MIDVIDLLIDLKNFVRSLGRYFRFLGYRGVIITLFLYLFLIIVAGIFIKSANANLSTSTNSSTKTSSNTSLSTSSSKSLSTINTKNKQPQEYMSNAQVQFYSDTGMLENQLSAIRWSYFPDKQTSEIITPHLIVYKADGSTWTVDASRGQLQQPTMGLIEKISLFDKVVILRKSTPSIIPIKLETEHLDYHPKKQYAEGEQNVRLTKPGLTIIGVGFRAFLDKGHVELLNDVQTYYTNTF